MKKTLWTSLFMAITFGLIAQNPGPGNGPGNINGSDSPFKVMGQVFDSQNGEPLEYVSAVLLNSQDSAIVNGAVTDVQGKFTITTRPGRYILQIQYISYHSKFINNLLLDTERQTIDIGEIKIQANTEMLDEVVVQGEKSTMTMTLDKRVFNVGKDLSNTGRTAADLLDNIPSISVDVEGNVSLRGSENVRILVDGRPSGLVGLSTADALRQLQGNMVERVEVVTNPSARYDAEGLAGIINIILKKENREGVNGTFNFTAGHPDNYGASFNLNYRKQWTNLFASYGVNYRESPGGGTTHQSFFPEDTLYFTDLKRTHVRGGLSNNIRFGSDFFLNPKNTITVAALYRFSDEDNESNLNYRDFDGSGDLLFITDRIDNENEDETTEEYSINYTRTFSKKGHKFSADVQYRDDSELEKSDLVENTLVVEGETLEPELLQRSSNEEFEKGWLIQADYIQPIGNDGQLELGVRNSIRRIGNDYLVEQQDENAQWQNLDGFSNNFDYDEDIYAAYAIYGNKVNKFSYQLGVRMEVTDLRTELQQTSEINNKDYTNFFPSMHLTYSLKEDKSLQGSYSRRIRRPGFRWLNPFTTFSDARNIRSGNPDLDPEYSDSYELGVLQNWENSSLFYSVYYRYSTGAINRISTVIDGITFMSPQNVGTRDDIGLEVTYSNEFTSWWKINGSANLFNSKTDGFANGEDLSAESTSFTTRIMSQITLKKKWDFQASMQYRAPQEIPQGRRKSYFVADLGLSRDVLSGNGTLTFTVNDLFNTRKWRSETFGSTFISEHEFQWRNRSALLSFNYRLNQKKSRQRNGNRGDQGGEDMDF